MHQAIKLTAFILLIVGTVGLLVSEFAADCGRAPTLMFAIFNCVGLVTLGVAYFGRRGGE